MEGRGGRGVKYCRGGKGWGGRRATGIWGRGGYVREGKYCRYVNGYSNCLGNRLWIATNLQMDSIGTHGESLNTNTILCCN
jgi:hypothetical protein